MSNSQLICPGTSLSNRRWVWSGAFTSDGKPMWYSRKLTKQDVKERNILLKLYGRCKLQVVEDK